MPNPVHVFVARHVSTMNASQPRATHVAVRDGRILGYGDAADMGAFGPAEWDDRFAGKVILPGFVEGHSHTSDAPVTPLAPLFTASCAVNRRSATGRVLGEAERITVAQALHAVTLGAAYTLHMDHLVGSIDVGKFADFAVLDEDPAEVDPAALGDVRARATVVGGQVFPS
ncbi:amidohydrolase family protein [Limobrevibacterium gyesilva]|uniref:Amidohydrolase family protein n=1 Tax=Limobrevibacterium gyesilva TaxID=2991712 RepID=A0AA41YM56_9PROT|nr:amidohydrolase family protein [Limobrevibacterium gyesilva]MCW3476436.1 amidohydrolase family protein [Limobrevibacterium gyesilva]